MRNLVLLFGLALLLHLQACQRKAVPMLSMPDAIKTVDVEEIDFGYMHGKARMVFRDDKREREVKANIRIRKDSVIWMTFSVVGVQGGKALINRDSITVVSNVDKEYYVFDYKELSNRFNFEINYSVLEAAMLGNLIRAKEPTDEIGRNGNFDVLLQHENTVTIKSLINPVIKKIEKVELVESNTNNKLMLEYANFQPLGEKNLPYNGVVSVFYKTTAGLINNTITFEYNKIEIGDKELKFPFNIPKRYDRR
ncbi:MAG: DUF4292 domain-containing protein [Cyclobacteriaceae bacterium]|jgi:hypothetical protein|nr:DUF4292 domain-containing protein [Cyclobacteriaceae bacterium]